MKKWYFFGYCWCLGVNVKIFGLCDSENVLDEPKILESILFFVLRQISSKKTCVLSLITPSYPSIKYYQYSTLLAFDTYLIVVLLYYFNSNLSVCHVCLLYSTSWKLERAMAFMKPNVRLKSK